MRVLIANDGVGDAGGVQSYLAAVIPALAARGHPVALLHLDPARQDTPSPAPAGTPHFHAPGALAEARRWAPDVVFSHNMRALEVERELLRAAPVVKFMHGYFGTCIGGQKAHLFPAPIPCDRALGLPCLALYGPRRCGRLSLPYAAHHWRWAHAQQALFADYAAMVVASGHMRAEYLRNGADPRIVHTLPLFPTADGAPAAAAPTDARVVFVGRMTTLKGGDLLVRAVSLAAARLGRPIELEMVGDGPQRARWQRLAQSCGVAARFHGWIGADARDAIVRSASVAAVSSVWPEPFGLAGLEAAALGVPSVAFDVGGLREWLRDGETGILAPGTPPTAAGLADALVRILGDPALLGRLRTGARAAAERMSLDRHVAALESLLASARGGPA